MVNIPEGLDRVALSIAPEDQGPYVVATREGRFVTCLARGMSIDRLHLVPQGQLEALMSKREQNLERWKLAQSLVGPGRETEKLVDLVKTKADDLTREEVQALSVVQPAIKPIMLLNTLEALVLVDEMGYELSKRKRFRRKDRDELYHYYSVFHAAGHFALLAGMSGPKGLEPFLEKGYDVPKIFNMTLHLGDIGIIQRHLFLVGKLGKPVFRRVRRAFLDAESGEDWVGGFLCLLVLGARHKKLRKPALQTVFRAIKEFEQTPERIIRFMARKLPADFIKKTFEFAVVADQTYDTALKEFQQIFFKTHNSIRESWPERYSYQRPEDVPEDLANTLMGTLDMSFRTDPETILEASVAIPWISRCEAEDFYWPQDYFQYIHKPFTIDHALPLIERERQYGRRTPKRRKKPRTGRNAPCPCGSGKKYKKCCLGKD